MSEGQDIPVDSPEDGKPERPQEINKLFHLKQD